MDSRILLCVLSRSHTGCIWTGNSSKTRNPALQDFGIRFEFNRMSLCSLELLEHQIMRIMRGLN